ncbi:agmatine deiminase family protein [Phocaeicola sp.]
MKNTYLPAEWHKQSLIQLTWPHKDTDWADMLEEVDVCFLNLAYEILERQNLIVVAPEPLSIGDRIHAHGGNVKNLTVSAVKTNDTWARDHAFISMLKEDGTPLLLDFCFNGWGMKFAANYDNLINSKLYYEHQTLHGEYTYHRNFVLEGGSIESDGKGTLLTTEQCLLAVNRNEMTKEQIEAYLTEAFNLKQILWLKHGYLAGDDTDSHVDTLARLCPDDTIAYVQCTDRDDEHYEELAAMEEELKTFRTLDGKPYRLLPLPMADAIYDEDGERLPATYANFLIMNEAVLYPTYHQPANDARAKEVLAEAFPGREIVGIDCRTLIKQHGSLHCVTMQYPEGVYQ